jgi:hypothetical protein
MWIGSFLWAKRNPLRIQQLVGFEKHVVFIELGSQQSQEILSIGAFRGLCGDIHGHGHGRTFVNRSVVLSSRLVRCMI